VTDRNAPSYGQLLGLLKQLGFAVKNRGGDYVCRHQASDTWIVLAGTADDPAREADVVAVHKQLTERGLISLIDFQRFLRTLRPSTAGPGGEGS
jgi:hypothetical protein